MQSVGIFLLGLSLLFTPQAFGSTITVRNAARDVEEVCRTIAGQYAYQAHKSAKYDVRWDVECAKAKALIEGQDHPIPTEEFQFLLADLLGSLRDKHTGVNFELPSSDHSAQLGIAYVDEGYWVYQANESVYRSLNLSDEEFVDKRFVLESLNGISIDSLVESIRYFYTGNDLSSRAMAANFLGTSQGHFLLRMLNKYRGFQIDVDQNVALSLKSIADGQTYRISYRWGDAEHEEQFRNEAESSCAERYGYDLKVEDDHAVMTIPTWDIEDEDEQCIEDFLSQSLDLVASRRIEKLVVDVRGNGGGTSVWERLAKRFMVPGNGAVITQVVRYHKPGFPRYFENARGVPHYYPPGASRPVPVWFTDDCKSLLYTALSPVERSMIERHQQDFPLRWSDEIGGDAFSQDHYCFMRPDGAPFVGKVAVLIDQFGYSSNDQFLSAMRSLDNENIVFIGRRTMGGSGGGGFLRLRHSGIEISYAIFSNWRFDGELIEDRGNEPDIEIGNSVDDLISGRDRFIEAALSYFGQH